MLNTDTLATIAQFLTILIVLVFVHELGHFIAAKKAGIVVEEFGIGFPPRLATLFKRGETVYTLNALPLGGFVKMLGEEDPSRPRSFAAQSRRVRTVVLVAGAFMNFVLAVVLFVLFLAVGEPYPIGPVVIQNVVKDSPAWNAGMQAGDVIVSIEGTPVQNSTEVMRLTRQYAGRETAVELRRGRDIVQVRITPRANPPQGQGPMGVVIGMHVVQTSKKSYPLWEAIPLGVTRAFDVLGVMLSGLRLAFQGEMPMQVTGPIGIARLTGEVAKSGLENLLQLAALLSVNLAIANLLPLPALDGGRLVFVILEALRGGKRIAPEKEGLVHIMGMMLLLSLIAVISYFDILSAFQGTPPLP